MRTGRLSPSWLPNPRYQVDRWPRSAARAAQAATLELVAHAMLLNDKCPVGRSSPWPRLNLAPTVLPSLLYQHDGRCGGHPGNVG